MAITFGSELKVPASALAQSIGSSINRAVGLTGILAAAVFRDDDGDGQADIKMQLIDVASLTATLNVTSKTDLTTNLSLTNNATSGICRLSDTVALYLWGIRTVASPVTVTYRAVVITDSSGSILSNISTLITEDQSIETVILDTGTGAKQIVAPVTDTKAIWAYWVFNTSTLIYTLRARVLSVSGTGASATVSMGTAVDIFTSAANPTTVPGQTSWVAVGISSSKVIIQYHELPYAADPDGLYECYANVLSVSGTTITVGATFLVSAQYASDAASVGTGALAGLTDTLAASLTEEATSGDVYWQLLTISGTSLSAGALSSAQSFDPDDALAVGFETDLLLLYDEASVDQCHEYSLISEPMGAPTDTEAWTPSNRPVNMSAMVGAATAKVITGANTTSAPTGHLYVRLWQSDLTPTPPGNG